MTASRPVMLQSAVITAPSPPPAAVSSCLQPLNYYGHRHHGPAVRKEIMLLIDCKALILLVFLYNPSDFVDIGSCCKHPYEGKSAFRHFSDIQCASTDHCAAQPPFFRQLSFVSQCNGYRFCGPAWLAVQLPPTVCLLSKQHSQAGEPQLTQSRIQTDIRSKILKNKIIERVRTAICLLPCRCRSRIAPQTITPSRRRFWSSVPWLTIVR